MKRHLGHGALVAALLAAVILVQGCRDITYLYPDPNLGGKWTLVAGGPFQSSPNNSLDVGYSSMVRTYPESTNALLNELLLTIGSVPSTYPVKLAGPYQVDLMTRPAAIDFAVRSVDVDLAGLRVALEAYLRRLSLSERVDFYASMATVLGVPRISDVTSLLAAMEAYQERKLLNAAVGGYFGLYDVFECDLLLVMQPGTRPENLETAVLFSRDSCR